MTIETALAQRLLELNSVTALVSTSVFVGVARQGVRLGVLVHMVGGPGQVPHLRGMGGVVKARIQVDSFAPMASGVDAFATAAAIDEAVMGNGDGSGLAGWRGDTGSPAIFVDAVFPDGEPVKAREVSPIDLYKVMRDYRVTYRWSV